MKHPVTMAPVLLAKEQRRLPQEIIWKSKVNWIDLVTLEASTYLNRSLSVWFFSDRQSLSFIQDIEFFWRNYIHSYSYKRKKKLHPWYNTEFL